MKLCGWKKILKSKPYRCVTFLLIFMGFPCVGQNLIYIKNKKKADSLFQQKQYKESSRRYAKVVKSRYSGRIDNLYLAICYSKIGNEEGAIKQLEEAIEQGLYFNDTNAIDTYIYFDSVQRYSDWNKIRSGIVRNSIKRNKVITDIDTNNEIYTKLIKRKVLDQKYRKLIKKNPYRENKNKRDSVWALQKMIDIDNQIWLDSIINIKGWYFLNKFGNIGNNAAWLIVQHADNDIKFQKKVLKIFKKEVVDNPIMRANYAYLTDRILINTGKKQKYGTQFLLKFDEHHNITGIKAKPLQHPNYVDEFRQYVGLSPLDEYLNSSLEYMKKSAIK